jgi:hypothetical protein
LNWNEQVLGQDTVVVFCENALLSQHSISLPAEGKLHYEWFTHTISVEAAVALRHASKTWRQRPAVINGGLKIRPAF